MTTESAVKHTPGPWEADGCNAERECSGRYYQIDAPTPEGITHNFPYTVADTSNRHHSISPEEDRANSLLLAAAPALLEALENTTQTLRLLLVPMDPIDADSRAEVRNEIELAETAIRLAKGGTQ